MAEPDTAHSASSDSPDPDHDGWLGDFRRGPAVFSVHRETADAHPHSPPEYRVDCNDGAGPRVICRFVDEPEGIPEWFGAWRGDEWCDWIIDRARALIADPQRDLPRRARLASPRGSPGPQRGPADPFGSAGPREPLPTRAPAAVAGFAPGLRTGRQGGWRGLRDR